jgi:hypothetical protein
MKQPIYNIYDEHIQSSFDLTQAQIEQAIIKASVVLGWKLNKIKDGLMIGTMSSRLGIATVDIRYSASAYSITYQDSANMEYDGKNIHKNYNDWVKNFYNTIQKNLSSY